MPTTFNQKPAEKMVCPRCGHKMNHHGDKVVPGAGLDGISDFDPLSGGVITEFHTCPNCGAAASRIAC
jgi:ribosomal protein S27AE